MEIAFRPHNLVQGVIKRTQIRVNLALEITRQESQLFSGLNGRPGKDNAPHLAVLKGLDGHGHGKVCLSRAGRSDAEHNHLLADSIHIMLLPQRLWLYRLAGYGPAYDILVNLQNLPVILRKRQGQGIIHVLFRNGIAPLGQFNQVVEHAFCLAYGFLWSDNFYFAVPGNHGHMQGALYLL